MNKEIEWIRSITPTKRHQSSLKVGIGDDAAIYSDDETKETVIAVDTMVEGVHFTKDTMPLKAIGHKALAVNISDLAAMGAVPLYYLVSIAIPKSGWLTEDLNEIYAGMKTLADHWEMDLIGGDTVSIDRNLVITVTALGKVEQGKRLLRSNASPEDVVFVTGPLGHSALGLEHLLKNSHKNIDDPELLPYIKAHQWPVPQVKAGRILAETDFKVALNDISDGLASEAKEIADASNVSVEIVWDNIPKTPFIKKAPIHKQEEWILYGGEDFQLIGTISKVEWPKLKQLFKENALSIHNIGSITSGKGEVKLVRDNETIVLTKTGYHHL
ncbi:thiamine-monophosphate kinase [Evansella vedderi]|uniref:Thiamine-monophosphate kinase n=1 Tax=Evansella vedderi TaxID=38282 RepID=A0ABT9ZU08_9BACI|nr:thiamine-phosphate kinase [Evansella vedderi]MDQ0254171.1 thiamine-monophosphate kinase [Evansella vedderi]